MLQEVQLDEARSTEYDQIDTVPINFRAEQVIPRVVHSRDVRMRSSIMLEAVLRSKLIRMDDLPSARIKNYD